MFVLFLLLIGLVALAAFGVHLYKEGRLEAFFAVVFITTALFFGTLATAAYKVEVAKEETAVTLGWVAFSQEELNNMSRNEMKAYPCIGFHYYHKENTLEN